MGEASGRLSDLTILTNDNPRQEDPLKIISDIVVGLQKSNGKYLIEPDREKAIGLAFDEARAGDIVLLAGKGHEDYQILGEKRLPWDDRLVAQRELHKRGFDSPGTKEQKSGAGFGT
jgi:UDP-N-acetylmuramoyl-L-alanyl-D-glutamate--2,6-diaminopimelate ligase